MATGQHPQAEGDRYDADAKANARLSKQFVVGGTTYLPVKKTGKVMKRVMGFQPNRSGDDESAEASLEFLDSLYNQLAALLRPAQTAEGEAPDGASPLWAARTEEEIAAAAEQLQEHLDLEEAREMLRILLPREKDDEDASPTAAGAGQPKAAS
jgi:hypothetical protein